MPILNVLICLVFFYSSKDRRGRLDLRIGSVLNLIPIGSVTHVGAHLAEEANEYSHFNLNVTWVEAIPELVQQIEERGLPANQKILQLLLSEKAGEDLIINLFGPEFALSSILEVKAGDKVAKQLVLKSSILDSLEPTNLLVLDVQGAELSVLKGGTNFLTKCDYIFIEVSLNDIYYNKTPTFSQIKEYLDSLGFQLKLKIMHGHDGTEGNCLFVKENKISWFVDIKLSIYQILRFSILKYRFARRSVHQFVLKAFGNS